MIRLRAIVFRFDHGFESFSSGAQFPHLQSCTPILHLAKEHTLPWEEDVCILEAFTRSDTQKPSSLVVSLIYIRFATTSWSPTKQHPLLSSVLNSQRQPAVSSRWFSIKPTVKAGMQLRFNFTPGLCSDSSSLALASSATPLETFADTKTFQHSYCCDAGTGCHQTTYPRFLLLFYSIWFFTPFWCPCSVWLLPPGSRNQ